MDYFIPVFGILVFFHFLADFPLQGDFLSKAKNAAAPIPGVPWQVCLLGHSYIHAFLVWLATGIVWFAFVELVMHAAIDYLKCRDKLTFGLDQFLHLFCKLCYAFTCAFFSWPVLPFRID